MNKINITETVLRDANQSLMATRMPSSDFEAILDRMDQAGYHSLECWGGATFDSCLR
jgi:oxaloacetate decarboxylase alpha subunit